MEKTRPEVLLLAAGAAAAAGAARGATDDLVITSKNGLGIAPFGDGTVPALSVNLPREKTGPAVVVEMPEHAWHKGTKADDPEWFYRRYTNDPRVKGTAAWTREKNALVYRMTVPSGFGLNARATLAEDGVEIDYEISNPDAIDYGEVQAITCVKLYRPFTDVFLERTYVHHAEGLDLLASETPDRLSKNAEEWLPCRYIARCVGSDGPTPKPVEKRSDGITYYYKQRPVDAAFIATESSPKGWVVATHSLNGSDVWTNPARTCHHADYGTSLSAKGSARLAFKLFLVRGMVRDAWARVAAGKARAKLATDEHG